MIVAHTIEQLKEALQAVRTERPNAQVGFVPTMGFLHQGHASLLKQSVQHNDLSVLSIFVNPIQFGPTEDLDRYPRDEERDLALAEQNGIDIVFLPTVEVMYPQPTKTKIAVSELTSILCGASRPGHFDGVTTVVAKLFNLIQPTRAYFGMKDAQQVAVIMQMVKDLNMNVEIVPCPLVRETDGLALSSRNVYLTAEQRSQALKLSESLALADRRTHDNNTLTVGQLKQQVIRHVESASLADIDYVEIVTFPDMMSLESDTLITNIQQQWLIALAVRYGSTRLIDNKLFNSAKGE